MNALLLIPLKVLIWTIRVFTLLVLSSAIYAKIRANGTFLNPFENSFWVGQTDEEKAKKQKEREDFLAKKREDVLTRIWGEKKADSILSQRI